VGSESQDSNSYGSEDSEKPKNRRLKKADEKLTRKVLNPDDSDQDENTPNAYK
jgi:hypothetical protein